MQIVYNQFETTTRRLEACISIVSESLDRGTGFEKFKAELMSNYERDCFIKMRALCTRFVELYDEMDTLP